MPTLLTFVACENAVVAQNQMVSLINILNDIVVGGIPALVAEGTPIPYRWFLFAEWELSEQDCEHQWEQKIMLVNPQGETRLENVAAFGIEGSVVRHRMLAALNFVPVLAIGMYRFKIAYREVGATDWIEARTLPLGYRREEAAV